MNNFVTVYELLGLIKDGKAPKKIKWDNVEWEFKEEFDDYFRNGTYLTTEGFDIFNSAKDFLDNTIEILEENKPIIEKIDLFDDLQDILNNGDESIVLNAIHKCLTTEKYKLNEIIDYINRKEDK